MCQLSHLIFQNARTKALSPAFMFNQGYCTTKLAMVTNLITFYRPLHNCHWETNLFRVDEVQRPRTASPFKYLLVPFISLHGMTYSFLFIFLAGLLFWPGTRDFKNFEYWGETSFIPEDSWNVYPNLPPHFPLHSHLIATIKFKNLKFHLIKPSASLCILKSPCHCISHTSLTQVLNERRENILLYRNLRNILSRSYTLPVFHNVILLMGLGITSIRFCVGVGNSVVFV